MPTLVFYLNAFEEAVLFKQDPKTKNNGGYQCLLVRLQNRFSKGSKRIFLTVRDIEKIREYAFKYGIGGWETRLKQIFGRVLGPDLNASREFLLQPEKPSKLAA